MKLRLRGNSLRLRLERGEVRSLAERGEVTEIVDFGGASRLSYAIVASDGTDHIVASFDGLRVTVTLPVAVAQRWASSEATSLSEEQRLPDGASLRLLIEKDFTCLNRRGAFEEDESDLYPNPHRSCGAGR